LRDALRCVFYFYSQQSKETFLKTRRPVCVSQIIYFQNDQWLIGDYGLELCNGRHFVAKHNITMQIIADLMGKFWVKPTLLAQALVFAFPEWRWNVEALHRAELRRRRLRLSMAA
jgi:hypothetical protein